LYLNNYTDHIFYVCTYIYIYSCDACELDTHVLCGVTSRKTHARIGSISSSTRKIKIVKCPFVRIYTFLFSIKMSTNRFTARFNRRRFYQFFDSFFRYVDETTAGKSKVKKKKSTASARRYIPESECVKTNRNEIIYIIYTTIRPLFDRRRLGIP